MHFPPAVWPQRVLEAALPRWKYGAPRAPYLNLYHLTAVTVSVAPPAMTVVTPIDFLAHRRLAGNLLERLHIAAEGSSAGKSGSKNHRSSREGDTQHSLHVASLLDCERRFDAK